MKEDLNQTVPRVLYIITDSGRGGAERVLSDVLQRLDRKVVNPCGVLVLKQKREFAAQWEEEGVPVKAIGMKSALSPKLFFETRQFIRSLKPDIVHSFMLHSVLLGRAVRVFDSSFKLVSAPHLNFRVLPRYARELVRWTRSLDDCVLCEGKPTRDFLIGSLGYDPQKTFHIPNGVDVDKFRFDPEGRKRFRSEWGILDTEILIGSVGRLHDQKGFDLLVEALNQLKMLTVKFKAVVVGEGAERETLEQLAKSKNVPIQFVGERANIGEVLSAFDIYVQSSRYEGMPVALLEAMSIGCPIVATSVDGTIDMAEDGKNMILVKPEDPVSLSVALGFMLEKKDLRDRVGKGARATAEKFTVQKMVEAIQRIYTGLNSPLEKSS